VADVGMSTVRFFVLGPLRVLRDGRDVTPSPPRQRALLAVLLVHANEPVGLDRLIDEIWGEHPPAGVVNLVRGYVSKLRSCLDDRDVTVLRTVGTGYLLQVPAGSGLDAREFTRLLSESRQPSTSPERRVELLTQAEKLWRGRPYSGVPPISSVQADLARLEEDRLAALEEGIELRLGAGEHAMVVGTLCKLAAAHPLRERLRHQLMVALSRCGRQVDALEVYREFRQHVREELGVEPSRALRELQAAVLRQDPSMEPPSTPQPPPVVSPSLDLTHTPPAPPTPAPPTSSAVQPSHKPFEQSAQLIQDRAGDDTHDGPVDCWVMPGCKRRRSGVRDHRVGATVRLTLAAIGLLTAVGYLVSMLHEAAHSTAPPAKDNLIEGTVHPDRTWAEENRDGPRHKTDPSDGGVVLTLRDNVDGGLCVLLRRSHSDTVFSQPVCWGEGEYGPKTLASGVRPGTAFIVDAKRESDFLPVDCPPQCDNRWKGTIFY